MGKVTASYRSGSCMISRYTVHYFSACIFVRRISFSRFDQSDFFLRDIRSYNLSMFCISVHGKELGTQSMRKCNTKLKCLFKSSIY